jgi:CubicO group peptidase (beta-lactamase class C family)
MKNPHKYLECNKCFWAFVALLTFLSSCELNSPTKLEGPLPMSGVPVPQLAAFDDAMQQYMTERNKKAGVLGVMKDGGVVFERGYGWKDKELKTPLPHDAMLRIGSIVKPITEAAVKKLIHEGRLNATDKVFCLPGSTGTCWLNIEPFGIPDPRLKDITIQNLLDHKVGWDETIFNSLIFKSLHIANALGIPSPPSKRDIIRFMMGQPLVRAPGTLYEYSNFGHVLLGVIIEQVTGQTYMAYVQDHIFNPLGVPDTEIEVGRSLPEFRNPREPWYESRLAATSVFHPPLTVPNPDGGAHLEVNDAAGGVIACSRALLRFMQAYWAEGTPRSGQAWDHSAGGALSGTFAVAHWRPDGVNFVALFNKRDPHDEHNLLTSTGDDGAIMSMLDRATDGITTWPTKEP